MTRGRGRPPRLLQVRFWEKVAKAGPDDCWEWIAYKDRNGYGRLGKRKRDVGRSGVIYAHRLAYALAHGLAPLAIPPDLVIRHRCDNPGCVNPAHLVSGTHADNVRDMVERERSTKGERNPAARITAEIAEQIRGMTGTNREIARQLGISRWIVQDVRLGRTWKTAL